MKAKFLVVPYILDPSTSGGYSAKNNINENFVVSINPPSNMRTMRVTFNVYGNSNGTPSGIVISDRPPRQIGQGIPVFSATYVDPATVEHPQPGKYVFENFDNIPIEQTFYVANIDPNGDQNYITVCFEGTTLI